MFRGKYLALALLAALAGWTQGAVAAEQQATLADLGKSLKIDADKVSVSGISSGGFMAHQFHVAHSGNLMGVGIIAGGPYHCAQGDVKGHADLHGLHGGDRLQGVHGHWKSAAGRHVLHALLQRPWAGSGRQARERCRDRYCGATIKVRVHVASPRNAPMKYLVASLRMFPLPHDSFLCLTEDHSFVPTTNTVRHRAQ